jgi:hypothetical protein
MNFYPAEYSVELTILHQDGNGAALVPTAITAVLYDGFDNVVSDFGALTFDAAAGQTSVLVLGQFNELAEDETRAARALRVRIDTANGAITKTYAYVIEAEQTLQVMVNTFQSYEAAEVLALESANVAGWASADETRRRAALSEAYRRVTSIPMQYGLRDTEGHMDHYGLSYISREMWREIDQEDFRTFPSHFRRALARAQFAEANELLAGDVIGDRRRAGILSETIGESSLRLNGAQVDYGVSRTALAALTGYIHFNMRINRT